MADQSVVEKKLKTENAFLRGQVDKMNESLSNALDTMEKLEARSAEIEAAKEEEHVPVVSDMQVLRDPFAAKNPHEFISHPPGFVLGWINPIYREKHRTMRGWDPVQYSDEIGKNLEKYLMSPPTKMAGAIDNVVRRGDVILCRLPKEWHDARQLERTQKANRMYPDKNLKIETPNERGEFGDLPTEDGDHIGGRTMLG